HTFMLEELNLQPGDVISYYARAIDNDAVSGAKTATSDIYFLTVRPFDQSYRQEQQGGGGGGGGGGGNEPGQLSQQQREIIAGTFNSLRDKAGKQPKELQEELSTLRIAQNKLKGQVEELAQRIVERGIAARDSNFGKIGDILKGVTPIMDTAEKRLGGGSAQDALPPEQRALQQLQRAEAVFREVRISMGGEGGGGGQGQQRQAEDLADLFELNKDKLRNQYESLQRGRQQQEATDQQVDETLEKLKRLAARQQQENERAQRKADSLSRRMGASGSSGGAGQRQLAQEAEEAARQLERLAREKADQQRQESASSSQS